LTEGLFESPSIDPRVRERLKERASRVGPERMHRLLTRLDPATARRLAPRDASRVIRALEVRIASGQPLSALHARRPVAPPSADIARRVRVLALAPPREELYERIDARADAMFDAGLVGEVRDLLASGVPRDAKAFGAHGYRRVVEYLFGERSLESAVVQTKLDTRHYAKSQMTWWRGTPGVRWIHAFGDAPDALRAALLYLRDDSQ
jgi:tRNA dimethylallyltransferase